MTTEELTKRLVGIDERVTKLESTQPFLQQLLEQAIETNKGLSDTMNRVQITMSNMDNKLLNLDRKVEGLDEKVNKMKDNQTFNIMQFMKKYFPWIVVGVGLIVYQLSKMFAF